MTDLLAEVDDMMRRERIEKIWHEHKVKILGALAAIIIITGAWSGYNSWNDSVQEKNTDALITLMSDPKFPANVNADKLDLRPDTRGVALLIAAKAYLSKNQEAEALKLYEDLIKDRAVNSELRQLGTLMKTRLQSNNPDTDVKPLLGDLANIYKDSRSPWRFHARLEAAVLMARLEDYAGARGILAPVLKEKNLPGNFIGKAQALDHLYGLRAAQSKNAGAK